MRREDPGVLERFAEELISGIRREAAPWPTEQIEDTIGDTPPSVDPGEQLAQYFALCERAWVRWSRLALEHITVEHLGQSATGIYMPPYVIDPESAQQAGTRCAIHRRLLDRISRNPSDEYWPWRLEAARHVHAATEAALRHASRLDPAEPPTSRELIPGLRAAADALITACAAGFISDASQEAIATIHEIAGTFTRRDTARPEGMPLDESDPAR